MTETQSHYTTPGNYNLRIPSRDEFHRYAVDITSELDFSTQYPSGNTVKKIAFSLDWTISNSKKNS